MKRALRASLLTAATAAVALALTACGGTSSPADTASGDTESLGTVKVGALQTPAGDILDHIAAAGEELGLTVEFVPFTDYNTPNTALADGTIDANLFQNSTFLENFNKNTGNDLVSVGEVYLPSAAFYSDRISDLDELADGASIAIPNDPTNEGRALKMLAAAGLIEVAPDVADLSGITDNPKNFEFKEIENATLPQALPDVDTAFVTIAFALPAGLTADQAILIEGEDSDYFNILATRTDLVDDPRIVALFSLLTSEDAATYMTDTWGGLVVPAVTH